MLAQVVRILKQAYAVQVLTGQHLTVGELSRYTKIAPSTVRRRLQMARKSRLVDSEYVGYKSTGKQVFWLTEEGMSFVECAKELF